MPMINSDFLQELKLRVARRKWWLKALLTSAGMSGIYGATIGAAIGAVPGAGRILALAAVIMVIVCGVTGSRLGALIGIVRNMPAGRIMVAIFAAIGGAVIGGFIVTMILLAFGAILGTAIGWFAGQVIFARQAAGPKMLYSAGGAVLGMFVGSIVWAAQFNQNDVLFYAVWGFVVGVFVGPTLLFSATRAIDSLAATLPRNNHSNTVDVSFRP